jgi:hypothetical protein
MVWDALELPTAVVGNVRFADNETSTSPLPLRVTIWGVPVALSLIVIVPEIDPGTTGLKATVIVQVCPAVSVAPVQVSVSE